MNEQVKKLLAKKIAPQVQGSQVRTSLVRLSYARLFEPQSFVEGGDPKYSVTLMIPKEDTATIDAIEKVAKDVATEKFGQKLPKFKNPLIKDGDEEENAQNHGFYLVRASTAKAPGVVKIKNGTTVQLQKDEIKSGDWALVTISIFAYDKQMNKGISAYLNNVLLVAQDEALAGGGTTPATDFGDLTSMEDLEVEEQEDDNSPF